MAVAVVLTAMSLSIAAPSLSRPAPSGLLRGTPATGEPDTAAEAVKAAVKPTPAAASDDKAGTAAASARNTPPAKVEVRREVADSGSIKTTTIGYSDGSTETLSEIGNGATGGDMLKAFGVSLSLPPRGDTAGKGLLIDDIA